MRKTVLLLSLIALAMPGSAVHARGQGNQGNSQDSARRELRAGNILPIRDIENAVIPTMGGAQYLGFEYDPVAMAYRLKFIRGGHVIFVDVDARTGQTIRRTR